MKTTTVPFHVIKDRSPNRLKAKPINQLPPQHGYVYLRIRATDELPPLSAEAQAMLDRAFKTDGAQ